MKRIFLTICFLALITCGMSACGVKPKTLQAPSDADQTAYPKTYPAKNY